MGLTHYLPATSKTMGKESCWKCKRLRTDVRLHACEERLCKPCAKYNDKCIQYKVFPKWDVVLLGQYPDIPGQHVSVIDTDIGSNGSAGVSDTQELAAEQNGNTMAYAEHLRVTLPSIGNSSSHVAYDSSDDEDIPGPQVALRPISHRTVIPQISAYLTLCWRTLCMDY